MRKEFSFSIWLMPEAAVSKKLQKITDMLSRKYRSPTIRPHMTLVGGFSGDLEGFIYTAEKLASQISPFEISLHEIGHLNMFFRSLFLRADKTTELMDARRMACRSLSLKTEAENYLPHLSLVYGEFSPQKKEEMKKLIARELKLPVMFEARSLHCVVNNEKQLTWPELAVFPLR